MRITGKPETACASNSASKATPRTRFSEVLKGACKKEEKQQPADADARDGEEQIAPGFAAPSFRDVEAADSGQRPGAAGNGALLSSLVHEITVEAPPGADASVDIQFDSRTLDGLHVRIQKAGNAVEVTFSTASEAMSRLLTANAPELTQALIQRGYDVPKVSVDRVEPPISSYGGESGARGSKQNRGQGQNRR